MRDGTECIMTTMIHLVSFGSYDNQARADYDVSQGHRKAHTSYEKRTVVLAKTPPLSPLSARNTRDRGEGIVVCR
jgi:hypothetical protein